MKTLHILHANPIAPSAGGTERYVAAIAAAQGDPVFAVDGEAQPGGPPLREVDAPFPLWLAAPPAEGVRSFRETWSAPWMEAALEEVVKRCAPRRGHIHHLAHVGAGWVERISQQLPLAYTLHDYHALCARVLVSLLPRVDPCRPR